VAIAVDLVAMLVAIAVDRVAMPAVIAVDRVAMPASIAVDRVAMPVAIAVDRVAMPVAIAVGLVAMPVAIAVDLVVMPAAIKVGIAADHLAAAGRDVALVPSDRRAVEQRVLIGHKVVVTAGRSAAGKAARSASALVQGRAARARADQDRAVQARGDRDRGHRSHVGRDRAGRGHRDRAHEDRDRALRTHVGRDRAGRGHRDRAGVDRDRLRSRVDRHGHRQGPVRVGAQGPAAVARAVRGAELDRADRPTNRERARAAAKGGRTIMVRGRVHQRRDESALAQPRKPVEASWCVIACAEGVTRAGLRSRESPSKHRGA
ncbi:MAG TPA: hypothetical protein VIV11_17750, partial [Kofleriaceae bacterium]